MQQIQRPTLILFLTTCGLIVVSTLIGQWLPGTTIAYSYRATNHRDLYLGDLRYRISVKLTTNPANDINPTWEPTGQRLAFVSDRERVGLFGLYVMDIYTREITAVRPNATALQPDWSPDGAWILYSDNGGSARSGRFLAQVVRPDGSEHRVLADGYRYDTLTPVWNPAGDTVLFVTSNAGTDNSLQRLDLATGAINPVEGTRNAAYPTWGADGTIWYSVGGVLYRRVDDLTTPYDVTGFDKDARDERLVFVGPDSGLWYGEPNSGWQFSGFYGQDPVWQP
ncbi:MAG: hypothetical protein AAF125_07515 [Chloroflexota bacterium]